MIKFKNIKTIEVQDWDALVEETYGRPYSFQQQDGCQGRGVVSITIPEIDGCEEDMNDSIPEVVNGEIMGVKFDIWLSRNPKEPLNNDKDNMPWSIRVFWERNFYPNINTIANDLFKRGLVESGDYNINVDW